MNKNLGQSNHFFVTIKNVADLADEPISEQKYIKKWVKNPKKYSIFTIFSDLLIIFQSNHLLASQEAFWDPISSEFAMVAAILIQN